MYIILMCIARLVASKDNVNKTSYLYMVQSGEVKMVKIEILEGLNRVYLKTTDYITIEDVKNLKVQLESQVHKLSPGFYLVHDFSGDVVGNTETKEYIQIIQATLKEWGAKRVIRVTGDNSLLENFLTNGQNEEIENDFFYNCKTLEDAESYIMEQNGLELNKKIGAA
ncbi:MAG: hypothetical protein H6622_16330 [Halobacteriovoraceae bacterium]|nr:hypothetical protein [Halobacteriovoraceae bacterium]